MCVFFFSSRRRHTRCSRDWSSDVCSSDLKVQAARVKTVCVILERREHIFPFRKDANFVRQGPVDKRGGIHLWRPKKVIKTSDRGGRGLQIVREIRVCRQCQEKS